MVQEQTPSSADDLPFPSIRSGLPLGEPFVWLRKGWDDLHECGRASLFYGICFSLGGLLLALVLSNAVHLFSAVSAGFMLVGPFLAIGLYELSRQRERGNPVQLQSTLMAWRTSRGAVGVFSLLLIILYLMWARASMVTFALFYEGSMPDLIQLINSLLRFEDLSFLVTYIIVGGFFALLVFASSLVSIPLMLDRDQDAVTAVLASVLALARNLPVALVWGAMIVLLVGIGIATAFLGLIITGPLVGHATWHAFRALVEPLPPTTAQNL